MDPFDRRQLTRRHLLGLGAAIGVGSAVRALAPFPLLAQAVPSKDPRLLVRSTRPADLETPVALLDDYLTPTEAFYVRSHMTAPRADAASWRLAIDGEASVPQALSLAEIERLPRASVTMTLECAGNGRAFFDPPVAGIQWRRGAVGTAHWTGVRLADLLRLAGARSGARFVWAAGGDRPLGTQPPFVRQVPIAKAIHADTLVAYAMNDRPLPIEHGFPLRLVVPGWEGAYSIKWLERLTVSTEPQQGFWVNTAYRYPLRPGAPGAPVDAKDQAPLSGLVVKSLITRPLDGAALLPGRVAIAGFAWAGEQDVARVDVSADGGATWQAARLTGPHHRFAWRRFEHTFEGLAPGSRVLLSRAADDAGRVQPMVPAWNPAGYLWNAPDSVRIDVGDGPRLSAAGAEVPPVASRDDPAALSAGQQAYQRACLACHDGGFVEAQRLSPAGWRRSIAKMVQWGARVESDEAERLAAYLASRWGAP